MSSEGPVFDDGAASVSHWHLAALHITFYVVSLVATLGLRSPVWLLLPLLYCGCHRGALLGRAAYPSWMWRALLFFLLLSAICGVGANLLSLMIQSNAFQRTLWRQLMPLWSLMGVQQWKTEAWLETILLPTVAFVLLSVNVLYMRHRDACGLRVRRGVVDSSTTSLCDSLRERWPRIAAGCHLAAPLLLTVFAWAAAWVSPPSCIGLWLEVMTFVFAGTALYALHRAWLLSPRLLFHSVAASSAPSSPSASRPGFFFITSAGAAHSITALFGASVAVLIVCVSATHNVAFGPLSDAYGDLCKQIGLGYLELRTGDGVRRAVQLMGMAVVVAGCAAVDTHVLSQRVVPSQTEREGLMSVTGEEEENRAGEENDSRDGHRHHHHRGEAALSPNSAPPRRTSRGEASEESSQLAVEPLAHASLFCTMRLAQVVAIACVMALLLHAVYFPSLVSLAMWLTHLCCCAGRLVSHPARPTAPLWWTLASCLTLLACTVVAQYSCLVLRVSPSTAAGVWQPALPYHSESSDGSGAAVAQIISEHAIALVLGLYLCTRSRQITPNVADGEARSAFSPSPVVDSDLQQPQASADSALGESSPHRSWMTAQLRNAAGNPSELRKVFEMAVGRSPRTAELNCLLTSPGSFYFTSARRLTAREVYAFIAAGPLYTYAIIVSLFVLGTSGASMDSLHATCLVLSLLFSTVGSNAVLYRRLRTLPPVWVAGVLGLQLGYRVLAYDPAEPSATSPALAPTAPPGGVWWGGYIGIAALDRREATPYFAVQLVLLWCCRYEPCLLTAWKQVWQCLVFRCRWTHLFRRVHHAAGFVVLVWIVFLLPRSVNVSVLVLLLFVAALLHHLRWHGLVYVWQRYLMVGYCGVVLLSMLLVEFAPMQPRLWRFLRALGCPAGSEGSCAQDMGFPSANTVWLTPLSLPWWFVIVLATAAGTPYALPANLASASPVSTPTSSGAEALIGWWTKWWAQTRSALWTVVLLLGMTFAALQHPSLLTAAYLVGPVCGIYPIWTFSVAAIHTALQCTYQFWFSPLWLDTVTLWGTPLAELIGLWRASSPLAAVLAGDRGTVPSTLSVATAPLIIGMLQALQQHQQQPATLPGRESDSAADAYRHYNDVNNLLASPVTQALRRLCASHLYLLLLLILLHNTQCFVMGWGVAALVLVIWWAADVRECGVLLRPRWLYRLCATTTASFAVAAYVLHWAHERFPRWSAHQRFPWIMGSAEGVDLSTTCWTVAVACVALQWSSGEGSDSDASSTADDAIRHPHSANFIWWLEQRIGRHRGAFGIRGADSTESFTPNQRDAFLADAAELLEEHAIEEGSVLSGELEGGAERDEVPSLAPVSADSSVCELRPWTNVVVQVALLVPVVACGFVAVGASASSQPSLLAVLLLLTGLLMALRHSSMQWSFWRWWRSLLAACAVLPLMALLFGCPPVHEAVIGLPPWVGLVVGFSSDATHVTGAGLRFTARHVALFFALWLQSCLYNNPQWGVRLLRLQYAEKQLGEMRHVVLQRQLVARVTRATEEATRVDREIRAYLDGLRAGDVAAETRMASEKERLEGEEREESEEARRSPDFYAEMDTRRPAHSVVAAPPASPLLPVITVTRAAERESLSDEAAASSLSPPVEGLSSSPTWRWWRQRCGAGLLRSCNVLAAYTYHPSEYRVSTSVTAESPASGAATLSLTQLAGYTMLAAVQVVLRHTPIALLACTTVNALVSGCLCELFGLCYVVQVALAYHPYAPRLVYQCFGLYTVAAILAKQLVMLWVAYDADNPIPLSAAGTLLPLVRESASLWSGAAASRGSLRYDSLWIDIATLAVVILHERVCVIHGVYVEHCAPTRSAASTSRSTRAPVANAPLRPPSSGAGTGTGTSRSAGSTSMAPSSPSYATPPPQASPPPPANAQDNETTHGVRGAIRDFYANIVSVAGVGEDWYISYTCVDLLALLVLAVTYSRMTANEKRTLQDNVQNNQLPGPMALLLCMSVLQLVMDRMFYVERCMRLKAAANWTSALVYCLLYWWWRNTVAVSARAAGNAYFSLKMVALVLSVTQVCRGYPVHRQRDAFTSNPGSLFRYCCFTVYRAIPFLWEVRTLIDWTVQHTALTLQEYLTLEDVYVYMYHCRERFVDRQRNRVKVGDAVAPMMKWLFGVSRLALILLALLGPLLYYSTYNPSTVVNKATQMNLELSFFGAHDFFSTTVHDNASTPDDWWSWLARTRPTVALYGQAATGQTVQLMEFTSCSGSQWMASPQAMRQILSGLRTAAAASDEDEGPSAAYILQSMEMTRSASSATSTTSVSAVNRWRMPKETAQAMVRILERETGASTTAPPSNSSSSSSGGGGDSDSGATTTSAVLPFFYSPFLFNRASRLDALPTDASFPHRNRQHCTLELHHERDVALNTMVRYWCLHCAPLFPTGNVPTQESSTAAEWRCLSTGEGCDAFNYEDVNETYVQRSKRSPLRTALARDVPIYMVVLSDSVVVGISFLKGIGIVALYTTFVLALGRLLRSVLANKVGTLVFENMANPAALENMVRCIGIAREYGDLRLEHTIYLELIDLLRSPERLFEVTGSLRCMYVDADQDEVFHLGQVRRRGMRRDVENAAVGATISREL